MNDSFAENAKTQTSTKSTSQTGEDSLTGLECCPLPKIILVERGLEKTFHLLHNEKFDVRLVVNRFVPTKDSADLYVFYLEDSHNLSSFIKIIEKIKQKFPETKVMFVGPYATSSSQLLFFDTLVDFVCVEKDFSKIVLEVCQKLSKKYLPILISGLETRQRFFENVKNKITSKE
jgi:hypothetical protein